MNADDFLDDKQTNVSKQDTSSSKDKSMSKKSSDSFLDSDDETPAKYGYGIDRILKHPVSAVVGELTSAAELITGLPKMIAEDVSTLLVPGALTIAEKSGLIKPSTKDAKVKVGIEAGHKLAKDLGLDILADAPTEIAKMIGLDKKTLKSSGVNTTMGIIGQGFEYLAEKTNEATGVPKEQIMAMLDLGMLKAGDALHPITKKINDAFMERATKITPEDVKAARAKMDLQSEFFKEYQDTMRRRQPGPPKPEDVDIKEDGSIVVKGFKEKHTIPESDILSDDTFAQGKDVANSRIISTLPGMTDNGLLSFIKIQENRLSGDTGRPINATLAQTIRGEVAYAKKLLEGRATGALDRPTIPVEDPTKSKEPPADQVKREPEEQALQQEVFNLEMIPPKVKVDPLKQRDWANWWAEDVKDNIGVNVRAAVADRRYIYNLVNKMKELVPDEKTRSDIWEAINRGETDKLTGKAKELSDMYSSLMDKFGSKFKNEGLIKGMLQDYATRIVDTTDIPPDKLPTILKGLETSLDNMPTSSRFGRSRTSITFDQFLKAVHDAGLKLKTTDIAEVFKEYSLSMFKASENRKLIDKLEDMRVLGKDIFIDRKSPEVIPSNYKLLQQGQFAGYFVHPEIHQALKFVMDAREPGMVLKAASTLTSALKRLNIGLSFFHGSSLTAAALFANAPKDIRNGNVFGLIKEMREGVLKQMHEGGIGDSIDTWLRDDGLGLGVSEDLGKGAITQIAEAADRLVQKYTGFEGDLAQKATRPVGWFQEKLDHATWNVLHDGLKLLTAEKYLEKAMIDRPNMTAAEIAKTRKEIAQAVNNIYGGLDWFEIARNSNNKFAEALKMSMFNPEGRRVLQTVLFAPDWTLSTIRAFTEAIPKNLLKPAEWDLAEGLAGLRKPLTRNDYARRYQMRYALYYLTLFNGLNMATSGHPIWENKDKTTMDLGGGQTLAFAKHPNEPFDWMHDFDKTLANKLGFLPSAAVMMLGGVKYASPYAPKMDDQSLSGRAKQVASKAIPFSVAGLSNGWQQALSGFIGLPIRAPKGAEPLKPSVDKAIKNLEKALNVKIKKPKSTEDYLNEDDEE